MKYFDMWFDTSGYPNQWFLDDPLTASGEELDAREFRYSRPYAGPVPAIVPIKQPGTALAFSFGAGDMPVVTSEVARRLQKLASNDIELFPVCIGNLHGEKWSILHVIRVEDPVDETVSRVTRWTHKDGRPDRVGDYHAIADLTIDPSRTNDAHLFRIKGWSVALIASEAVKEALSDIPQLGVVFKPVTKP